MEEQRVDVSGLGYPVEWLLDVWTKKPGPITVGQVIQLSKDDVPPETIVRKMQDSESVYRFTAAQLAQLHDMGVADPVLNYMQQTYIERERRQQSLEDWDRAGLWGPYDW